MFGSLGGAEILMILVLALLLFGPRNLPQIGRSLGKGLSELRRATRDFKTSLENEVEMEQIHESRKGLSEKVTPAAVTRGVVARDETQPEPAAPKQTDPAQAESPGAKVPDPDAANEPRDA